MSLIRFKVRLQNFGAKQMQPIVVPLDVAREITTMMHKFVSNILHWSETKKNLSIVLVLRRRARRRNLDG